MFLPTLISLLALFKILNFILVVCGNIAVNKIGNLHRTLVGVSLLFQLEKSWMEFVSHIFLEWKFRWHRDSMYDDSSIIPKLNMQKRCCHCCHCCCCCCHCCCQCQLLLSIVVNFTNTQNQCPCRLNQAREFKIEYVSYILFEWKFSCNNDVKLGSCSKKNNSKTILVYQISQPGP